MVLDLTALDPKELVLLLVGFAGLIPVWKATTAETKLFALGYAALLVGAVATNLEALVLGDVLNLVEHVGGLMASGLLFAYAAYRHREERRREDDPAAEGGRVAEEAV